MVDMARDTKGQIENAIRSLATGEDPVCTAAEIADWADISKVTVNQHIADVLEDNHDIKTRTVGQTPIYFTHYNRLSELPWDEKTISKGRLPDHLQTEAEYYVLRRVPENEDFDCVVNWYDQDAELLDGYFPTAEEMGHVISGYGTEPLAIKFYDEK